MLQLVWDKVHHQQVSSRLRNNPTLPKAQVLVNNNFTITSSQSKMTKTKLLRSQSTQWSTIQVRLKRSWPSISRKSLSNFNLKLNTNLKVKFFKIRLRKKSLSLLRQMRPIWSKMRLMKLKMKRCRLLSKLLIQKEPTLSSKKFWTPMLNKVRKNLKKSKLQQKDKLPTTL